MRVYEGSVGKSKLLIHDIANFKPKKVLVIDIVGIHSLWLYGVSVRLERNDSHEVNRVMVDHILDKLVYESHDIPWYSEIEYIVLSLNMPKEYLNYYHNYEKRLDKKFFITIQEDVMPIKVYEII